MTQKKILAMKFFIILTSMLFAFSANAVHRGYYDNHGNYVPGPVHGGHNSGGYGYGGGGGHNSNPVYNNGGGNLICVTDHGNCRIAGHGQVGNSCRCGSAHGFVRGSGGH